MADSEGSTDESQKTEEPTPRRLEEARKRGQVAHSREINNWFVLFAATLLVVAAGPSIMSDLQDTLKTFLERPQTIPTDSRGIEATLRDLFLNVGGLLLLPLLILSFIGGLSSFIQNGAIFSLDPLKPDFSKVSIIKGMGRLFSFRSVIELVKSLVKFAIISAAGVFVLMPYFDGIEHFTGMEFSQALFELQALFLKMMVAVLAVLFVVAVLDFLYQRHEFMKNMRMSKQELREEFKQSEGDPQVKAKLRELRERRARQRMMQSVPEADVVITNPTHFAVALKYDTKEMDAPMMVAKGADAVAEKIKEIAKENKVPIVENAPLARALYDSMEIEQSIPREHYKAVAEVISYVFKLKGKRI